MIFPIILFLSPLYNILYLFLIVNNYHCYFFSVHFFMYVGPLRIAVFILYKNYAINIKVSIHLSFHIVFLCGAHGRAGGWTYGHVTAKFLGWKGNQIFFGMELR